MIAYGPLSEPNLAGAIAESTPLVPGTPVRGDLTSHLVLHAVWPIIQDNTEASGGLTTKILSYNLQWDSGNPAANVWTDLQGFLVPNMASSYSTSKGITGGTWYRVRVRAMNKYGWGDFSPIISIIAALAPSITPVITTVQLGADVGISWGLPPKNGLAITKYDVLFQHKNGSYLPTSSCLGTDP